MLSEPATPISPRIGSPAVLGDPRAPAVGAVEVAGADVVRGAVVGPRAVPDGDRDALVVDGVGEVLGASSGRASPARSRRSPGPAP